MRKVMVLLMFALIGLSGMSQQITFQKTYYGNIANGDQAAQQTTDGGFIVCSWSGFYGVTYLIKTNINGDTLWTKTYFSNDQIEASSIQQISDGGYIITGSNISNTNGDMLLIKIDSIGNILWSKTTNLGGFVSGNSVKETNDGGYIIACNFWADNNNGEEGALIKVDGSGNFLWQSNFGQIGGFNTIISSVQQTIDGGYIVTGSAYGVYLIKADSNGNIIWAHDFGGNTNPNSSGYSVRQTIDGGYIIAGSTDAFGAGLTDVYLIKTDTIGNLIWSKTYGGTSDDVANCVNQTSDGGYIIAGYTYSFSNGNNSYGYVLKTDANGNLNWSNTYIGDGYTQFYYIQQTFDGGYIIGGSTSDTINTYLFLIKTDSIGNSGCNEGNPATIVTTPMTIDTNLSYFSVYSLILYPYSLFDSSINQPVNTICFTTSNNESLMKENSISLYPNPTSGIFTLSYNSQLSILHSQFKIYDVTGREVYTLSIINQESTIINVSNLSNGIYFYQLTNKEETYRRKFVKESY